MAEQALLHQRLHGVDVCLHDGLGRIERATAGEDGEAGEETPLLRRQQLIAPFDRGPQRLVTRLRVPPTLQQVESLREPLDYLRRRQHARSRRGQLDGQRQVVERHAELGDNLARFDVSASREELDSLGCRHRRDRIFDLPANAQQLAARDEDAEVGAAFEQIGERGRGIDDLFEVVQDQQQLPLGDVRSQCVAGTDRARDHLRHECGVAHRRKSDPEHAVSELGDELGRSFDRQP